MRYMVIVKANSDSENGVLPSKEQIDAMGVFNQELIDAGVMLAGEGLAPSSEGFRVRYDNGKNTVIDGPFAESKELVAGFWILKVNSREEIEELMKKAPFGKPPFDPNDEVEVRRIFELDDFPEGSVSDEIRQQEDTWREKSGYA